MSNVYRMTSILVAILFIIPTTLFSQLDSLKGNVSSIREQIFFLDSTKQSMRLFSTDSEYGHYGFQGSENQYSYFDGLWFNTPWTSYLNYYRKFDSTGKLVLDTWYSKKGRTIDSIEYQYDDSSNLIQERSYNRHKNYHLIIYGYNYLNQLVLDYRIYQMSHNAIIMKPIFII